MAVPLRVSGAWVQLLSDWLDQQALSAPALRAALDGCRPAEAVPLARWRSMLDQAVAMQPQQRAPGLAIGALVQPRHVGVLGYLILACETLGEAMHAYRGYERLLYGADVAELHGEAGLVSIRWPAAASTGLLADTVAIAALWAFLRRLLGDQVRCEAVSFAFAPPTDPAERQAYQDYFACPVSFAAAATSVSLPVSALALRLPNSDPDLHGVLERQAQDMLQVAPDACALDQALQQVLVQQLPEGRVTLPRVAARLHTSVRSLQRHLALQDLSWRQVLDGTREQLARQYLADASLSATDVAFLLGFSEQSAFSRAFRRWTATTPEAYRRQLHAARDTRR